MAVSSPGTSTSEQFAARELGRSWASSSAAIEAARAVERGEADAWRAAYRGMAELGIFGVALPEEHGGGDRAGQHRGARLVDHRAQVVGGAACSAEFLGQGDAEDP